MKKILIMGLPGSGKTHFAEQLKKYLEKTKTVSWINADKVRKKYNDWDFSYEGRIRQSVRMCELADSLIDDFVIADFVAPLLEMRDNFKADWTIWIDTIKKSQFEDTNKIFTPPKHYDFKITDQNIEKSIEFVGQHIISNK
jgi:adenylylsulfate kinase